MSLVCTGILAGCTAGDADEQGSRIPADSGRAEVSSQGTAGSAFATPEEALENLVIGLNTAQADTIVSSFAPERFAAGFDFVAWSKRALILQPGRSLMPSDHDLYRDMNAFQRTADSLAQVKMLIYTMISAEPDAARELLVIRDEDGEQSEAFAGSVDPAKLEGLTIERTVEVPAAGSPIEARAEEIHAAQAKVFAADEIREFMVLYRLGDETFEGGFTAARFGDAWSIETLGSALGGTDASGAVESMSADEFDAGLDTDE